MDLLNFGMNAGILWLAVGIIFVIVEASTVSLVSIWFAGGALAAMLVSLVCPNIWVQIVVFLIVSLVLLGFTRKFFVGKLKTGKEKTNTDALIGEIGIVTADIEPIKGGQVKINGLEWKAVVKDEGPVITKDSKVKIKAVEGVKLIVVPVE